MDVVVNPPRKGEPSYESFIAQKEGTLKSLAERAKLVADTFNSIEGFTCQTVQGAMYAFPRVSPKPKYYSLMHFVRARLLSHKQIPVHL